MRRRVARAAAASFAAIVSLFSAAASQTKTHGQSKQDEKVCQTVRGLAVERKPSQTAAGSFAVEITDPVGAAIPGATVTLTNDATGEKLTRMTDDAGVIRFDVAAASGYTLEVSAASFKPVRAKHLRLSPREAASAQIAMPVSTETETVGIIIMDDSELDGPGNGTTIFGTKKITSLPHG